MGQQRQGEWHVVSRTAVGVACAVAFSMAAAASSLVEMGARLFADPSLSADGSVACASCHRPDSAFADAHATSPGVGGKHGTRNAPSLVDVGSRTSLTWDGRTAALSDQILAAFTHPREMALADGAALVSRIDERRDYRQALGRRWSVDDVRAALGAYLRSLESRESAFDRWRAGDTTAIGIPAQRCYALFIGAAGCAQCHRVEGPVASFTDDDFHAVGVGLDAIAPDLASLAARAKRLSRAELERAVAEDPGLAALGRFLVTGNPRDIGKYRTPSLRNVAVTAPYFHDGSAATLASAVSQEIYYRSQERGRALALNTVDQADLVAFLESLTDPQWRAAKGE